jgi:uncharacterized protein (TIGR03083 family)
MVDIEVWIQAIRGSHERFAALVSPLDEEAVQQRSYADEWSIADLASHLGSQAEIYGLFVDAGLSGQDGPDGEQFVPIWDRWNGRPPAAQVADSVRANEEFVRRIEGLSETERTGFMVSMFGSDTDLAALIGSRFGEHAVHVWDVEVVLDPAAVIADDAVALLVDRLPGLAARAGKPAEGGRTVVIETVAPERRFVLTTGPEVDLTPDSGTGPADLRLPAESFVRLVYGRLDPDHTPADLADNEELASLRPVFTGF